MKKIFLFATMFAISLSMLAQEYMHVWQDGKKTDYVVTEVDSVTFNKMMHNGHEYVDLGLPSGTLWATCNVGATKPEEYGDYFAWGETEPKSIYDWSTYKWCNGSYDMLTKYCTNSSYGTVDNKTTLDLSDDAARANWGGSWRMPTMAEQDELRNNCTWTWTTQNGVNGYKVTSKSNGNSIFLPAAGYRYVSSLNDAGIYGSYWSSSLNADYPNFACALYFYSDNVSRYNDDVRYYGVSVRPVCRQNSMSQRAMYIWQNGGKTTFVVADVDSVTFTKDEKVTPPTTGTENGYEWVDLGLSVKWATCNVGASKPEEYGDYFAWGETQPKEYYDMSTYKWYSNRGYSLIKYCSDSNLGYNDFTDYKTTLELSDDAARANWGGSWRMPTTEEQQELINKCTWEWTSQNGVFGHKVIGLNGKSIFLPAAGYRYGSSLYYAGSLGGYWSSSLNTDQPRTAWGVHFDLDYVNYVDRLNCARDLGFSVRPVYGEYIPASTLPTVTTSSATNISATSVTIGGNVTSDGGTSVTERGVVYSTSQNPTMANSKVTSGSGTGSFICSLTNLQEGTTYYVRAYATNEKGTSYGNQVVFTTLESPIENVHEYVDLGLSVKWATCNVGATKPEEYGDYFAWGETEPKSIYDWSTYKWCRGSSDTQTKYCINSSYGTVDNKTTLELSDDAARANWGGSWRMPTDAELTELREQCIWTWTSQNGVYGYKVTSKKSGYTNKSIFLPAAGRRNDSSLNDAGSVGDYWSSSLYTGCPISVCGLYFDLYNNVDWGYSSLQQGHSVRPVCQ